MTVHQVRRCHHSAASADHGVALSIVPVVGGSARVLYELGRDRVSDSALLWVVCCGNGLLLRFLEILRLLTFTFKSIRSVHLVDFNVLVGHTASICLRVDLNVVGLLLLRGLREVAIVCEPV